MRRISAISSAVAWLSLMAACTVPDIGLVGEPVRDAPQAVRVDAVTVADDGMSVRVEFVGGKEFDPDDPCSVAYEGTAEVAGDELVVGIFAQPHPMPLPEGWGCEAMGYRRNMVIELAEPFDGTQVRDLTGQVILIGAPTGLAEINGLPDGWELRREGNVGETAWPRWDRIFSPDEDPWPAEGDSMVELIQAFGGPVNTTGAELLPPVEVNGKPATLYLHPPTGELVLVWSLGADELAMVAYLKDFTVQDFIALAESVVPAD